MSIQQMLLGAGGSPVTLRDRSYSYAVGGGTAYAGVEYLLESSGDEYKCENDTGTFTDTGDNWLNYGSGYYIRCHLNSGDSPSGDTQDTWLALTTTRWWRLASSTVLKECNLTIEIAGGSGGTPLLASCTVNLAAEGPL